MIIEATVSRDGKWWVVRVPIADRVHMTQGRTLREAQEMADNLVALWAEELGDDDLGQAEVHLSVEGDAQLTVENVREAQRASSQAAARAHDAQIDAVAELRREGLGAQDIATLMGISRGRVSQLAKA